MDDPHALHQAYARLFACPDGETVLADLEARAGLFRSSFSGDPSRTAFNEGRRSMALHVRHMLDAANFPTPNPNT